MGSGSQNSTINGSSSSSAPTPSRPIIRVARKPKQDMKTYLEQKKAAENARRHNDSDNEAENLDRTFGGSDDEGVNGGRAADASQDPGIGDYFNFD